MLAFLGVQTVLSAGSNVHVLPHQLHGLGVAGLVVVLEIAPDNFTDKIQRQNYLDISASSTLIGRGPKRLSNVEIFLGLLATAMLCH